MRTNRTRTLKIRVTEDEMTRLAAPLTINGKTKRGLSRLLRARLLTPGSEQCCQGECRHCRLLMAAVNNLNVIARRCVDFADPATAGLVLAHLAVLEREIRRAADIPHK
jgi:hypothetical protein